jgi:uridine kinase
MKRVVIGIAGGTGSGKTTVAKAVLDELAEQDIMIIPQDSYYRDRSDLTFAERERINYDHPDAIDNALLVQHIDSLLHGEPAERPVYDFKQHNRSAQTVTILPARIIIIEGIMVLVDPALRDILDIKIFVDTDPDVRFIRRLLRDLNERGRTLDSVVNQYLNTVRLMHMEFVEPSKRYADIIIPEGGFNKVAIDFIVTKARSILDSRGAEPPSE